MCARLFLDCSFPMQKSASLAEALLNKLLNDIR